MARVRPPFGVGAEYASSLPYGPSPPPLVDARIISQAEKDVDDPSAPPSAASSHQQRRGSLTTLSRLFAVASTAGSEHSRPGSYNEKAYRQLINPERYTASRALPDHLYTRGLLEGRHSDIRINAFDKQYRLHRLILDRAPFFSSALSEPWLEPDARELTIHPEDVDSSITKSAFELALKRLYGCAVAAEESRDPIGLFATACWLEMQDLIECSVENILRQMAPIRLSCLIRLVTGNYYGRAGDKILASAKAMLCRDGWKMPIRFWDGIPGDVAREIVGSDGFFIDSEWDRWLLAKRILDRRLRRAALSAELVRSNNPRRVQHAPDAAVLTAVRFDSVYRANGSGIGRGVPDNLQKWVTLYTLPEVEPLLVLMDEGIHYVHLEFEQLQFIRQTRDVLGLPVMSEKVISNALWQQMELRQKVMNASERDLELGISLQSVEDTEINTDCDAATSSTASATRHGSTNKQRAQSGTESPHDLESGSWDGNGRPRKFWIPTSDCNIVMGGNTDPVMAAPNECPLPRNSSCFGASVGPQDLQWAADFAAVCSQTKAHASTENAANAESAHVSYSHFPPFRFAAEFPNPKLLKERKRVYSRTVFYAGSLWNIYIQKVASPRSRQLGVYLHRVRETEDGIANTAGLSQGSVDERIGQLEREMILRTERIERRQRRRQASFGDREDIESSGSGAEQDNTPSGSTAETPDWKTAAQTRSARLQDSISREERKAGQTNISASSPPGPYESYLASAADDDDASTVASLSDDSDESETERLIAASRKIRIPALPPYIDSRPTIKTYFKIYSPSRGGRMLSVYESAPDTFDFSQSWGWKSSTLMLDEGLLAEDVEDTTKGDLAEGDLGEKEAPSANSGVRDGKLRFMVVVGNV